MNSIGNVLALCTFTQFVVDVVQAKVERGPTTRCEECLLLSGFVQDAYIIVVFPQLQDSILADVEGLHVIC